MPQMAPLLWLNLFLMFILIYMVFIIMNYFSFTQLKLHESKVDSLIKEKSWKW